MISKVGAARSAPSSLICGQKFSLCQRMRRATDFQSFTYMSHSLAGLYSRQAQSAIVRTMSRTFAKQMRFDENIDYYLRLGVKKNATAAEIKKRFYELAKKHHPDAANSKPSDAEKFKQITDAYDVLSNKEVKQDYDAARNATRQ